MRRPHRGPEAPLPAKSPKSGSPEAFFLKSASGPEAGGEPRETNRAGLCEVNVLLGRVIAYGVSNFRRSGFLGVVITKEKWKFAKRCSLRRLNVIQTKRNLLRPPSGLNRYPRLGSAHPPVE